MYDNSDNESVSFRSELSTTVSMINECNARPFNDNADKGSSRQPTRPSSSESFRSAAAPQSPAAADRTQTLPRPKTRNSRRSGRNSRRSSRNTSFDRQSTVSLHDLNSNPTAKTKLPKQPTQPSRPGLLVLDVPEEQLDQQQSSPARTHRSGRQRATSQAMVTVSDATADNTVGSHARPGWFDAHVNCRPATLRLVRQLGRTDTQLQEMMATNEYLNDAERLAHLRAEMLDLYAQLFAGDVRFAHEHQIEAHMWKTMFYNQVEAVKKRLAAHSDALAVSDDHLAACRTSCLRIIDEGLAALERMLHQLEETFNYRLDDYIDVNAGASKRAVGTMRVGLVLSEALLLHLGDLARYKEQLGGTKNFGRAKQWYTKAQHLMPTNGKPFNALAVIAIQTVSVAVVVAVGFDMPAHGKKCV